MVQHSAIDHTGITGAGAAAHIADTSDAHDASAISFSPAGTIAATDVQAAIEEVATEAGAAGGVASGTSFPGSPANNDLFYRTDRDLLYFYDGTRWLTVTLYTQTFGAWNGLTGVAGTDYYAPVNQDYDMWLVDLLASMEHTTSASGNYFTATLYSKDGSTLSSAIAAVNGNGNANNTMTRERAAINAALATGADALLIIMSETGTATLFGSAMLTYRLIG